jgi:hypothetical protein
VFAHLSQDGHISRASLINAARPARASQCFIGSRQMYRALDFRIQSRHVCVSRSRSSLGGCRVASNNRARASLALKKRMTNEESGCRRPGGLPCVRKQDTGVSLTYTTLLRCQRCLGAASTFPFDVVIPTGADIWQRRQRWGGVLRAVHTKRPHTKWCTASPSKTNPGSDLLSHTPTHAVPSAVAGLTSVFGMGTGVTLPL